MKFETTCKPRWIEGRAVLRDTCGSTRPSPRDAFSLLSLSLFFFFFVSPLFCRFHSSRYFFFSAPSHIPADIIVNIDHSAVDNTTSHSCATTIHGSIMLVTNFKEFRFENELSFEKFNFNSSIAHTAKFKSRIFRFFL